ncbi:MAG: hypothetical protein ACK6AT_19115 [Planctomycetota bacterium]
MVVFSIAMARHAGRWTWSRMPQVGVALDKDAIDHGWSISAAGK